MIKIYTNIISFFKLSKIITSIIGIVQKNRDINIEEEKNNFGVISTQQKNSEKIQH